MATTPIAEAFTDNEVDDLAGEINVGPAFKSARIKGTWLMQWGMLQFDFQDGKRFTIPADLYDYLRSRGCIYDTLA